MNRWISLAMFVLVLSAQAAKLRVELIVNPGVMMVQRVCIEPDASGPTAAMNKGNYTTTVTHEQSFCPGLVSVDVVGGRPPYRYDWHGRMANGGTCSSLPGLVEVTVTDAAGSSVTRVAKIGYTVRIVPAPCDNAPLDVTPNTTTLRPAANKPSTSAGLTGRGQVVKDTRSEVRRIPRGPAQSAVRVRAVVPPVDRSTK